MSNCVKLIHWKPSCNHRFSARLCRTSRPWEQEERVVGKRTKTAGPDATEQTGRSASHKCVEPMLCRLCCRFLWVCVSILTSSTCKSFIRLAKLLLSSEDLRARPERADADETNRTISVCWVTQQTVVRMHVAVVFASSSSACLCVCLILLCKVNPGVSLSCDATLQPCSWEGEITTWLHVPPSVCSSRKSSL